VVNLLKSLLFRPPELSFLKHQRALQQLSHKKEPLAKLLVKLLANKMLKLLEKPYLLLRQSKKS